jgi:hypothetical protein
MIARGEGRARPHIQSGLLSFLKEAVCWYLDAAHKL